MINLGLRSSSSLLTKISFPFSKLHKNPFLEALKAHKAKKNQPKPSLNPKGSKYRKRFVPLSEIVKNTLRHFQEKKEKDDPYFSNFLDFNNWSIKSQGSRHELLKEMRNKVVTVVFYNQRIKPDKQQKQEQKEEDDLNFDPLAKAKINPISITVYVRNKEALESAMCLDFLISNQDINMLNVLFTDDYHTHKTIPKQLRSKHDYQGPRIDCMNQMLRIYFIRFFMEHGINDELTKFIVKYCVYSQGKFLLEWLRKFDKVV